MPNLCCYGGKFKHLRFSVTINFEGTISVVSISRSEVHIFLMKKISGLDQILPDTRAQLVNIDLNKKLDPKQKTI